MATAKIMEFPRSDQTLPRVHRDEAAGIMLTESDALVERPAHILKRLSPVDRSRLLTIGEERCFAAGETVWRQGDPHEGILIIDSGRIRSFYIAPSGREVTLAYWSSGNFVGGPDIFSGGCHMWCSTADRPTKALYLPSDKLRQLTLDSAAIAVCLLDALAFKARCYSSMAQMLGTRSASERLHRLLVFLASVHGVRKDDYILIAASFTHADLAALIGSTRQWVQIQLGRLQDQGLLHYHRGSLRISYTAWLAAP